MIESWLDLNEQQAAGQAEVLGLPAYRGKQIWQWVHRRKAVSYDEMTDLPKSLRERLSKECPLTVIQPVRRQQSAIDGTVKYLFSLGDGSLIESVLMQYKHGYTVCVSTQVGCRMGCAFCASTLNGLDRNMTPGEILGQIYRIEREEKVNVSHVVLMGCGEPLDNYGSVIRFLKLLHDPDGQGMSYRNMTLSTCGLIEPLKRWILEDLPVTLAISLHAPNDEIRRQMMPVARSVSMGELLDVCREYTERSGKRITFEYALVRGVNDGEEHAAELVGKLQGLLCHVNLIPVNPVRERGLNSPEAAAVKRFAEILEKHHIPVTLRRELGRDIDGACGQLRRRIQETETEAVE